MNDGGGAEEGEEDKGRRRGGEDEGKETGRAYYGGLLERRGGEGMRKVEEGCVERWQG